MRPTKFASAKAQFFLDLGCGRQKQAGAIGMDKRKLDGVDVVHDIEDLPWPFADATFTTIIASHIVEHLKPWLMIEIIDECWRVLKPNGQLLIATPYAGSMGAHQDPTHVHCWNEATAHYFDPDRPLYRIYEPKPWTLELNSWHANGNLEIVLRKRDAPKD